MNECPAVKLSTSKMSENVYREGENVWVVANLIEHSKALTPFDLPLAAIHAGADIWKPVSSAIALAKKMRRVLDADMSCPIILDEEGFIMDGWHRVARALLDGKPTIKAVRFDKTPQPDYTREAA